MYAFHSAMMTSTWSSYIRIKTLVIETEYYNLVRHFSYAFVGKLATENKIFTFEEQVVFFLQSLTLQLGWILKRAFIILLSQKASLGNPGHFLQTAFS